MAMRWSNLHLQGKSTKSDSVYEDPALNLAPTHIATSVRSFIHEI